MLLWRYNRFNKIKAIGKNGTITVYSGMAHYNVHMEFQIVRSNDYILALSWDQRKCDFIQETQLKMKAIGMMAIVIQRNNLAGIQHDASGVTKQILLTYLERNKKKIRQLDNPHSNVPKKLRHVIKWMLTNDYSHSPNIIGKMVLYSNMEDGH
ncbi:unnamed protein product [Rhizophagus irregularis]|nr:unnamed protein product [Rhizophagus irregularis]